MNDLEQEEEERRYEEAAEDRARQLDSRVLSQPLHGVRRRPAVQVGPDDRLDEAIRRMADGHQGCAVVVEDGRLVGIFTERDALTRVLAKGVSPRDLSVKDVMTSGPERLTLDDTLGYALHKTALGGIRHLPVVDADGRPVGVISQQEAVQYLVGFFPEEIVNQPPRSVAQRPPRHRHGG